MPISSTWSSEILVNLLLLGGDVSVFYDLEASFGIVPFPQDSFDFPPLFFAIIIFFFFFLPPLYFFYTFHHILLLHLLI